MGDKSDQELNVNGGKPDSEPNVADNGSAPNTNGGKSTTET